MRDRALPSAGVNLANRHRSCLCIAQSRRFLEPPQHRNDQWETDLAGASLPRCGHPMMRHCLVREILEGPFNSFP